MFKTVLKVLVIVAAPIHVGELLEAWAPVVEVVVVMFAAAGRVEGTDGSSRGAATLIVEHQQRVIGGCSGVVICCPEAL